MNTKNLTEGRPSRLLLFFSLPLMMGNIFQQLYTVVDTAVVGKVLGVNALAAPWHRRMAELAGSGHDSGLHTGLLHSHGSALRSTGL